MKKLFCDCCGEEIDEKKIYTVVSVTSYASDDEADINEEDFAYNTYDLCEGCGKRFETMFKNWREFK